MEKGYIWCRANEINTKMASVAKNFLTALLLSKTTTRTTTKYI